MTSIKTTPKNSYSLRKSLLTMAVAAALVTGCGGSDDKDKPEVVTSIGGVAAKGIVTDGIVTAYLLGADGEKGAVVGTAVTDNEGSYSLSTASSYDGTSPLLLELTAGADTRMVCDSFNDCGTVEHGDLISLADSDFLMSSVIPGTGSDTEVSAAITAFTNMAAHSVIESGVVSDTSILETTSKINQVVGVNILETTPVNVASESLLGEAAVDSQRYSIMLAALATQAFTETGSVADMLVSLDNFNADFAADGDIGDEGGLSLIDLYSDANEAAEAAEDSLSEEAVAELATLGDSVVGQLDDDGVFTPEATNVENPSDIAQAKAFVTEIRTWATDLQDLESPAELFVNEADTLAETLGDNSEVVLEVYAMSMGAALEAISDAIDADQAVPTSVDVMNDDDVLIGTVNILDNSTDSLTEYVLAGTDLSDSNISLGTTLSLNLTSDAESVLAGDTTFSVNSVVSDSNVQITLVEAALTVGIAETLAIGDDSDQEPEFTGLAINGSLAVAALENGVATGEAIAANAEIKFVALDASLNGSLNNDMNMNLEKIALNNLSIVNDSGETASLSLSLVINNSTSSDSLAFMSDDAEETSENFTDATLSISGKITLDGKGEAVLSITGNKTGLDSGNLTAALGYDGKSLQLTAETTNGEEDGTDAKLTFSNADGVAMTVEESDDWKSGVVTVGDSIVGHIDEDGIIRYNDGTFESL